MANYLNNQEFFKPNYYEAFKYLIPNFYLQDDLTTFGDEVDLEDQIVNGHIQFAVSASNLLNISAIPNTIWSSINTVEGIAPFFVKQNNLTHVTPEYFNRNILKPLGQSLNNFATSSDFASYVSGTLLPGIALNAPTLFTHSYLIEKLSWVYFFNTSAMIYSPSSLVTNLLIDNIYQGKDIQLVDCMKVLSEYLWRNNLTQYYPIEFASSTGTYTSGTQGLDNLKTWMDILYSPLYADRDNLRIKGRFDDFISADLLTRNKTSAGPFQKFLKLISFVAFDSDNDVETIKSLYSINDCPDEYLPLLAELIGWRLFGTNPDRWRLQLRNAVDIYKRIGTKKSIQYALNTIFPKGIFNIESRITELWESYIPFLLMYALATESDYFKNFSTWTRPLANSMHVAGYSTSSMEDNIKLAVDRIILETYTKFPERFRIPGKDNKFNYRGRSYEIPPFEEYPYYVNVELTPDMVDFLADRLSCFGVNRTFALQFRDYILDNTINTDEDIRSTSWLFFTTEYQEPPNLDTLVLDVTDQKINYASLWNGKSSHFKLVFDSNEFNFELDDDFSVSSGDAAIVAAQIVGEFSPAHAIPLISVQVSTVDYAYSEDSTYPIVDSEIKDSMGLVRSLENYGLSGLSMNLYTRNNTSGRITERGSFSSLPAYAFNGRGGIGSVPRNTFRRRSYENLMPQDGYYDRTGFNMPVSWSMASSLSGIPLGLIPSSMAYETITDYLNLPAVYSKCYTLDSTAVIYGYNVSNTLNCRGYNGSSTDNYFVDRGQLPDIYATMHYIGEARKTIEASAYISNTLLESTYLNPALGYANQATESSGWFPNSKNDYYNFAFGYDFHQYYKYYTNDFARHRLSEELFYLDGPNIWAHTFGSILRNSEFKILGVNSSLASTSLSAPIEITASDYDYQASSIEGTTDAVVSSVVDGVDLILPFGGSSKNSFSVIKLPLDQLRKDADPYMFENSFIQCKSYSPLPRIRFNIIDTSYPVEEGHPLQTNFLLPESKYKFDVKALATSLDGLHLGNAQLGIWIHTKAEGAWMWSWTDNGWVCHDPVISYQDLLSLSKKGRFTIKNRLSGDNTKHLQCIDIAGGATISPLLTFSKDDFEEFSVEFDTMNNVTLPSPDYARSLGQVHRKTQNYLIEVFPLPDITDTLILFDKVNLVNQSLNRISQILVSGTPYHKPLRQEYCPEYRVELDREQIRSIFKFWNDISGKNAQTGYASRDSAETSSIMYSNGGSRLDYRIMSTWTNPSYYLVGFTQFKELVSVNL